jgi:vancomycin resistance protein VanJ
MEVPEEEHQVKGSSRAGWRKRWRFLLLPVDVYAALLVAYLLLRVFTTGHFWPVELISVVAHWLLLLAILLLPVALAWRHWPGVILLSISGIAFLWLFGGLFVPWGSDTKACGTEGRPASLTVMTYNISNGLATPDSLIEAIGGSGAEVVGLQELPAEQIPILQRGLQEAYPHQALYGTGISGIGLLSRYPLMEEELFELQGIHPYLRAELEIEGKRLTIIVAHPPVTFGPGAPEAPSRADMWVLAEMAIEARPTIVIGDFNFTDQNEGYQVLIGAGLVDAHRSAGRGLGLTYPLKNLSGAGRIPLIRIDHVLVTEDVCPERAWVGADGSSDHLPVLATLRW